MNTPTPSVGNMNLISLSDPPFGGSELVGMSGLNMLTNPPHTRCRDGYFTGSPNWYGRFFSSNCQSIPGMSGGAGFFRTQPQGTGWIFGVNNMGMGYYPQQQGGAVITSGKFSQISYFKNYLYP